ncbi:hypothetical protein MI467_05260 [Delftia acidovorans]|nr:hypothetical protein [Delftia acidovorans]
MRSAEAEFGHALVRAGRPFQGFTAEGEQVLAWARQFSQAVDASGCGATRGSAGRLELRDRPALFCTAHP